jgi:hypothetical protein
MFFYRTLCPNCAAEGGDPVSRELIVRLCRRCEERIKNEMRVGPKFAEEEASRSSHSMGEKIA